MDIREFKFQQTDTTWLETGLLALIIILHEIPVIPKILGGNPTIVPFMMLFLGLIFIRRKIRIRKKNLLFAFAMIVFASFQILYKVVHISTTGIGMYVNMVAFFRAQGVCTTTQGVWLFSIWTCQGTCLTNTLVAARQKRRRK